MSLWLREGSVDIRKRVTAERELHTNRFDGLETVHYSAQTNTKQIREHCKMDDASKALLKYPMEGLNLTVHSYDRILKIVRTITDIENRQNVLGEHISGAIQYRSLDSEGWLV